MEGTDESERYVPPKDRNAGRDRRTPRGIPQATCAGTVYRLDPEDGEAEVVASLGEPVAAPLIGVGDDAVAVDAGGIVRRFRVA